jgi:hypothetical protein
MKTSDINRLYQGLLVCYKDSYPVGQIVYTNKKWIYIDRVQVDIALEEKDNPHELIKELLDSNIIDNVTFINYYGKTSD